LRRTAFALLEQPGEICQPDMARLNATQRGDANAHRNRNLSGGSDWPDLVGCCDVQVGPRGRLGNEVGGNIAAPELNNFVIGRVGR